MGNLFKTALLLAALTCLVVLIGGAIGGQQGMLIAFVPRRRHELRQLLVLRPHCTLHVPRSARG